MYAVGPIVGVAVSSGNLGELDVLGTFAQGDEQEGLVGEGEGLGYGIGIEGSDAYAVESHLGGLEQHALCRYAEVDIYPAVFGYGAAYDDVGRWLIACCGQVEVGEGTTQLDVWVHQSRLLAGDHAKAQALLVAGRGYAGVDIDDAPQLLETDGARGVVAAVAAVAQEQLVEGGHLAPWGGLAAV